MLRVRLEHRAPRHASRSGRMTDSPVVPLTEGLEFRILDIDRLEPHPDNPNVEDLAVFTALVDGMKRDGFTEPVLVIPHGEKYRIIGGEHRWKAAAQAGITRIPAIVKLDWDETQSQVQLVRMNAVRGQLDPERFARLYAKLKAQMPEPALRQAMGFGARDAELRRMMKSLTKGLPPGIAKDLDKRSGKIRNVEDLAGALQAVIARHGGKVDGHFLVFAYGGENHLLIQASEETYGPIQALAEQCAAAGVPFDTVLAAKAACACEACAMLTATPAAG